MNSEKFLKQIEFLKEIDKAKEVYRQSKIIGMKRCENDAEHSWHVAVMLIILREYFDDKADTLKALKMMLMHDLVEIYAGDTPCYDETLRSTQKQREKAAAQRLYSILPSEQREEMISLYNEFEEGRTMEAQICNIMDRLQPTMLIDGDNGVSWKERSVLKKQVIERDKIALEGPDEISKYVENVICKAHENGYLK